MFLSLLISVLLPAFCLALLITNDSSHFVGKTFDYVIVGGGAAGLAIAHRLTERHQAVLVIEAGMDQQNTTEINDPGQEIPSTFQNPNYDWLYPTLPQQHNRSFMILAGKCLGGSTCINNMMLSRGTVDQYDGWEKLGNPTWNFQSMQSFMKKSEGFHIPDANQTRAGAMFDPKSHGFNGPVSTGFDNPLLNTDLLQASVDNFRSAVPSLVNRPDFTSGHPNGVSWWAWTIHPGPSGTVGQNRRSTSAVSYVYPFQSEKLSVLVGHQAARIVWDKVRNRQPIRAAGVEFIPANGGKTSRVFVHKEVVVSAGTIGSPRFLELSGVGNPTVLKRAGVNVVVNLPAVGTNLQDHAAIFGMTFAFGPNNLTLVPDPNGNAIAVNAYMNFKQVLGTDSEANKFAEEFVKTIPERAAEIVRAGGFTSVKGLEAAFKVQADSMIKSLAPIVETLMNPTPTSSMLSTRVIVPSTRGTVHISSSNPLVLPDINPTLLTSHLDRKLLVMGLRLNRRLAASPPIAPFVVNETVPGFAIVPKDATDEEWENWIFDNYRTSQHPVGTVSMMPRELGGAVNPELTVYGTANVRVADASIIPIHVSAHTSSTAYGIGEKAADIILNGL